MIHTDKAKLDLLRQMQVGRSFKRWMTFLILSLIVSIVAYAYQLKNGLAVTGMRDYISWGLYIANFVFFVAVSLIGMLISAVLGLLKQKWSIPLTRIAEIIALAFAMVAGLVIIVDMGRPDRVFNLFKFGRFSSPIIWDVTVVTTYVIISALLLLFPLIPDLKICADHFEKATKFQRKIYQILSFGWKDTERQRYFLNKGIRFLSILVIPVALAIHTVTSWLFASTLRPGWDSSIFGPYFVTGAFVAGTGAVIIAMYFFRMNYGLRNYLTDMHFDKMAKLLVLVSLVYLYFNINEFLVPAFKMKSADAHHIEALFDGKFAIMFWSTQILGLILPIILLIFKTFRKAKPAMIISIFVVMGAWLKRYLIVIPTLEHPAFPIQNVPAEFMVYIPTGTEIIITYGTIVLALLIITILAKFLPIIPIWETTVNHSEEIKE